MNQPTLQKRTMLALALTGVVLAAAGCSMLDQQSSLVAFTTQLRGGNEVPPVASNATGSVDAVLDKNTNLLRWKVSYAGLSGPATAGHFHGPAAVGANAGVVLGWKGPMSASMEGNATITPAQAADLIAGKWYANIHTAAHPGGEIRGQMTARY
ncbi:MAG: CHRD domain-containing protein [Polaromonas sp.]|nr:CHRD domain-containing protein [Polaromonas sp.]